MKTLAELAASFAGEAPPELQIEPARNGGMTARWQGVYLHSRYNPQQDAARLVESSTLNHDQPVLLLGLGLGYVAAALRDAGHEVLFLEPLPALLPHALQQDPRLADLMGLSEVPSWDDADFVRLIERKPQVLVHPPTANLFPGFVRAAQSAFARASLGKRFNIAIVGPMYGGSEPIAGYLADAFKRLGHNTLLIGNASAWPLYEAMTKSVDNQHASQQLGGMFANLLAEWTYARVTEFDPEICIVLAQAPVSANFAERLAKRGTLSAFWYVENWRHMPYWRQTAPLYDYFFHIQPGEFEQRLDEAGCRHHAFVQTACDPEVHRPVALKEDERKEFDCDMSFAGAGYYNRVQFFRGLTDYKFKIWGVDWNDREVHRLVVGGQRRFDNEVFMKIVAGSRINLNLHSSTSHDGIDPKCDAINPRVFEIAAAGGFQLCDPAIGLDQFFDSTLELPTYTTLPDLRRLIDYYLAHPDERQAIADAARERAIAEHTYVHRAQQMLDLILDAHAPRLLQRGVRVQRTVAEMAERLGPKSELATWLKTLPPETPFAQASINAFIQPDPARRSDAEKIFCYLHEVRDFAETLLKEQR